MIVFLAFVGVILGFASLRDWRFGLYGLLIFLPYAGLVSLRSGQDAISLLLKDIVFVIPAYISFFIFHRYSLVKTRVPGPIIFAMIGFVLFVFIQGLNPNLPNYLVPLVGMKIWLLYLPLAFLAAASIETRDDLRKILRIMVWGSLIPLSVGLLQRVGLDLFGREATAALLYGADLDVDRFGLLLEIGDYGAGSFYRINSTFASNGNYYVYTLVMVLMSLALTQMEREGLRRYFAYGMVVLSLVASFLSGARGAAVFVVISFVPVLLLGKKSSHILVWGLLLPVLYFGALTAIGIDVFAFLDFLQSYAVYNSQEFGVFKFVDAIVDNPLGLGTGMNTGAARYAFPSEEAAFAALSGVENYYVKTIVELSVVGLVPVLFIVIMPIVRSASLARSALSEQTQQIAAAFCGFFLMVAILGLRFWPLDADPVNVMFWILLGVLCKLPWLDAKVATRAVARPRARPVYAPHGPQPTLSQ